MHLAFCLAAAKNFRLQAQKRGGHAPVTLVPKRSAGDGEPIHELARGAAAGKGCKASATAAISFCGGCDPAIVGVTQDNWTKQIAWTSILIVGF